MKAMFWYNPGGILLNSTPFLTHFLLKKRKWAKKNNYPNAGSSLKKSASVSHRPCAIYPLSFSASILRHNGQHGYVQYLGIGLRAWRLEQRGQDQPRHRRDDHGLFEIRPRAAISNGAVPLPLRPGVRCCLRIRHLRLRLHEQLSLRAAAGAPSYPGLSLQPEARQVRHLSRALGCCAFCPHPDKGGKHYPSAVLYRLFPLPERKRKSHYPRCLLHSPAGSLRSGDDVAQLQPVRLSI